MSWRFKNVAIVRVQMHQCGFLSEYFSCYCMICLLVLSVGAIPHKHHSFVSVLSTAEQSTLHHCSWPFHSNHCRPYFSGTYLIVSKTAHFFTLDANPVKVRFTPDTDSYKCPVQPESWFYGRHVWYPDVIIQWATCTIDIDVEVPRLLSVLGKSNSTPKLPGATSEWPKSIEVQSRAHRYCLALQASNCFN